MTFIQTVNTGSAANDGTGDALRTAFTKLNDNMKSIRSDITSAPHAVIVGDSLTAHQTELISPNGAVHGVRGYFSWLQVRLGFPFNYTVGNTGAAATKGDNKGISGDTTTGVLARLQADVLDRRPDIVFVWCGTNDINSGASYATVTSNLNTIYQRILDQGATVIAVPVTPRNAAAGTDWAGASQRRTHLAVNHWINRKAQETQGMLLIDPCTIWTDPTSANGDARSGFSTDGVHCSPTGGYWMGEAAVATLGGLIRPIQQVAVSQYDQYDATYNPSGNLLSNGLLTGTGGTVGTGASGTVATGWQLSRSSGSHVTATGSKTTRSDGLPGDVQQIVLTVNGSGSGTGIVNFATSPSSVTTGLAAGAWVEGSCEIEVSASSGGGSPVEAVYLDMQDVTSGGSRVRCFQSLNGYKYPNVAWKGVFKTPPLQLVGTDGLRIRITAEMAENVNDSVTVKLSRMTMRRRLTTPVF